MRTRWLLVLLLFILTFIFFNWWLDWHQQAGSWRFFLRRSFLIALLGSLFSYAFRFWRWHFFLKHILRRQKEKQFLPFDLSLLIFSSGLATVVTPLRSGEILKPLLVKEKTGVAASKTVAVVVFERLTDALAMLFLMSLGIWRFSLGQDIFWLVLVFIFLFIWFLHYPKVLIGLINWPERWLGEKYRHLSQRLLNFYHQAAFLARPKFLFWGLLLGILAWGSQMLAASYLVAAVSQQVFNLNWVLTTFFIFSFAAALGFGIPLPGGIGVAEPTVAGLLSFLLAIPPALAVTATLLVRFATLWFGVSLGLIAFQLYRLKLRRNG